MGTLLPKLTNSGVVAIVTPLFFFFFLGMILWVYRNSKKSHYEEVGKIPVEDNE